MAARRAGHGFWPYWAPYLAFLGLVQLGAGASDATAGLLFALQVAVPLAALLAFAARGSYPELRVPAGGARALALDAALGVVGGLLWMAPYVFSPAFRSLVSLEIPMLQSGDAAGFDREIFGPELVGLALAVRGLGFGVVTPFVEELMLRSWLARWIEVRDGRADFRDLPIGHFGWASFAAVVVTFLATHLPWEAPVGLVWIVGTQLWLYHRRRIASLVVLHAASNLTIFAVALVASGPAGAGLDLGFFL